MADTNDRNDESAWRLFVTYDGKVTSLVSFGTFVEIAPGIEGLLHVSDHPASLSIGDEVRVRVERLDGPTRRLSLVPA
jgi:small subunit ribosomal protein S1